MLGSATPSLESFHNARNGKYTYLQLAERIANRALARAEIIDMRDVFAHQGRPEVFSEELLAAIEEGRPVAEIREFLAARSGTEIPDAVARLLDDAAERSVKLQDRGPARLIECADPALAALLANDSRIRKYCMRAGDRHLAVPASSETAFKRAVKEAGYLVQVRETASRTRAPQSRRASPPNGERGRAGESPVNETGEAGVGSAQRDELEAGVPSAGRTVGPASNILQALEAQAGD